MYACIISRIRSTRPVRLIILDWIIPVKFTNYGYRHYVHCSISLSLRLPQTEIFPKETDTLNILNLILMPKLNQTERPPLVGEVSANFSG
jgi:hypothetical protein